jgi:ribokinase
VVVVFGSINLDFVARVDRLPQSGETVLGRWFGTSPGGKGANQALAARLAGADVALYAVVGNDALAIDALANLRAHGVDLGGIARAKTHTGVALISVDAKGENAIAVVAGANAQADASIVPDARLDPGAVVVMQLETPLAAVTAVATRAHERGARVLLNAAPAARLPLALFEAIDVLVVNRGEAAAIADALDMPPSPAAFARALSRRFDVAAIVTLGPRGAVAIVDQRCYRVPAPAVDVVDAVGAGDAFVGALASALDRGAPWPRALAEAVAAGTLACTSSGAQTSLPSREAIGRLASDVEARMGCAVTGVTRSSGAARTRTGTRRRQPRH